MNTINRQSRLFLGLILFVFSFQVFALTSQQLPGYYGNDFLISYQNHTLPKNENLLATLFRITSAGHIKNANGLDEMVDNCQVSAAQGKECRAHNILGYDKARLLMFGRIDLRQDNQGMYFVKDVYCQYNFSDKDFGGKNNIGPNLLPTNGAIVNTEHTWPQSRFTGRFNTEMQKSDLHHLFPSDSTMNSHRGSLRFGWVQEETETLKCTTGRLGHQKTGEIVFEPPVNHRGNVARALFYFATRYKMKISPNEEAALRDWNKQDPVDAEEFERNNQIEKYQGNRNPFVDFPELVDQIKVFQTSDSVSR